MFSGILGKKSFFGYKFFQRVYFVKIFGHIFKINTDMP